MGSAKAEDAAEKVVHIIELTKSSTIHLIPHKRHSTCSSVSPSSIPPDSKTVPTQSRPEARHIVLVHRRRSIVSPARGAVNPLLQFQLLSQSRTMSTKDPTLFTQTGPHASAKPMPPRGTTIPIGGPAPPNETPQQKVARLREAARRSKLAQESAFDKVVSRGRVVADYAHRFTTLSLIGFTGMCTVQKALG